LGKFKIKIEEKRKMADDSWFKGWKLPKRGRYWMASITKFPIKLL
jgi:hypothetical protein